MRPALAPGGLLLIGEPFWREEPPAEAYGALGFRRDEFTSLPGTLDRLAAQPGVAGDGPGRRGQLGPVRGSAQWWTVARWLDDHPDHPDAPAMRDYLDRSRRSPLAYGRRYLGWGVFVLRPAA